jgi:imidazoleglycerol phosphate synthase cyclase subunit
MLTRRIVACLDIDRGRVVKGVRFQGLRDAGDPVGRSALYEAQGADEVVLLDVSATPEGRGHALDTVRAVRTALSIPLTAGGGIRSPDDAAALLEAGADKVAVNTAAVRDPALLEALAERFGVQCVTLALDAARTVGDGDEDEAGPGWEVLTRSGRERTGIDAVAWAAEAERRGAGEVLLTSWDRDGTGAGYDLELIEAVRGAVLVPLVASGGARTARDLALALGAGADAVLIASMLHDDLVTVGALKRELAAFEVRP